MKEEQIEYIKFRNLHFEEIDETTKKRYIPNFNKWNISEYVSKKYLLKKKSEKKKLVK